MNVFNCSPPEPYGGSGFQVQPVDGHQLTPAVTVTEQTANGSPVSCRAPLCRHQLWVGQLLLQPRPLAYHTSSKGIPGLGQGTQVPGSPGQGWTQCVRLAPRVREAERWRQPATRGPRQGQGGLIRLAGVPHGGREPCQSGRPQWGCPRAQKLQATAECRGGCAERHRRAERSREGAAQPGVLQLALVFHAAILKPGFYLWERRD